MKIKIWLSRIRNIFIGVVLGGLVLIILWNVITSQEVNFICNKIERDSAYSRWLVYSDNEIFEISNQWSQLRFNGRKVAQKIAAGRAYCARVQNVSLPLFNWYRNIMDVRSVDVMQALPTEAQQLIDSLRFELEKVKVQKDSLN